MPGGVIDLRRISTNLRSGACELCKETRCVGHVENVARFFPSGVDAGGVARHRGVCDRRGLRVLRQASTPERDGCRCACGLAQDLPNGSTAIADATSYAAANTPSNLSSFNFTYQVKCTNTAVVATGCDPSVNPNQLTVSGTAVTDSWFARLFGVTHFDVSAHANACSPCSSTPVDIVIAVDRTGSCARRRGREASAPISTMPRTGFARCWEC